MGKGSGYFFFFKGTFMTSNCYEKKPRNFKSGVIYTSIGAPAVTLVLVYYTIMQND